MSRVIEVEYTDTINNHKELEYEKIVFEPIPFWKNYNFWIESIIFVISVLGAICIVYGIMKGFLLWFISNSICIVYFIVQKQYPLSLQQFVFLITTILGIVQHSDQIFKL